MSNKIYCKYCFKYLLSKYFRVNRRVCKKCEYKKRETYLKDYQRKNRKLYKDLTEEEKEIRRVRNRKCYRNKKNRILYKDLPEEKKEIVRAINRKSYHKLKKINKYKKKKIVKKIKERINEKVCFKINIFI